MPTVHLSLPDKLYEELRQVAENYGIQVTDLIKVLIKNGIALAKNGNLSSGAMDTGKINELAEKLSRVESTIEDIKKQFERQGKIQ
ncbi:MAG: hypothetical protein QW326_03855, partial [Fervidicoccaceae archaeon]